MATVTGTYADEVRAYTDTYLEQVQACTAHLPDALEAYGTDRAAFVASVDRLSTVESECDATLRELRALVGEAVPPNYTEFYLRGGDAVRLYAQIDAIPNRVEQFCRELGAIEPTLDSAVLADLREMGRLVVQATRRLADVTSAYVESLVTAGDPVRVTDAVGEIATLETDCDDRTYAALERAFSTAPAGDALVVHALVRTLDAAMDAVEDAADFLLSLSSTGH